MKVLLTGAPGMLGQALDRRLAADFEVVGRTSAQLDVTDAGAVDDAVTRERPDWIVHAAAFTDVDGAESRADEAFRVNAAGTRNLAAAAHRAGSRLLYYSTDYVFGGGGDRPFQEWDPIGPINAYGRSKAAGELFVRALCPEHLIVRTSWLFGGGGTHFVSKILQRAATRPRIQVIDDQRGRPTYTEDLADASARLMARDRRGLYHVTNSGDCSWFEFAARILELAGSATAVEPVPTSAFPTPAARPAYSVLDNSMWRLDGEPPLREWPEALRHYLQHHHDTVAE